MKTRKAFNRLIITLAILSVPSTAFSEEHVPRVSSMGFNPFFNITMEIPNGRKMENIMLSLKPSDGDKYFVSIGKGQLPSKVRFLDEVEFDGTGKQAFYVGHGYSVIISYNPSTFEIEPTETSFKQSKEMTFINYDMGGVHTSDVVYKEGGETIETYYGEGGKVVKVKEVQVLSSSQTRTILKTSDDKTVAFIENVPGDKAPRLIKVYDPASNSEILTAEWISDRRETYSYNSSSLYKLTHGNKDIEGINVRLAGISLSNDIEAVLKTFDVYINAYALGKPVIKKVDSEEIKTEYLYDKKQFKVTITGVDNITLMFDPKESFCVKSIKSENANSETMFFASTSVNEIREGVYSYDLFYKGMNSGDYIDLEFYADEANVFNMRKMMQFVEFFRKNYAQRTTNSTSLHVDEKYMQPMIDKMISISAGYLQEANALPENKISYPKAIELYDKAIELLIKIVGDDKATCWLGLVYLSKGEAEIYNDDFYSAIGTFTHMLELEQKLKGTQYEDLFAARLGEANYFLGIAYSDCAEYTNTPELYIKANKFQARARELGYDFPTWEELDMEEVYNGFKKKGITCLQNSDINALLYSGGLESLLGYKKDILTDFIPQFMTLLSKKNKAIGINPRLEKLQEIVANKDVSTSFEHTNISGWTGGKGLEIEIKLEKARKDLDNVKEFLKTLFEDGRSYSVVFQALTKEAEDKDLSPKSKAEKLNQLMALSIVLTYFASEKPDLIKNVALSEIARFGGKVYVLARSFENSDAGREVEFKLDYARYKGNKYLEDIKARVTSKATF